MRRRLTASAMVALALLVGSPARAQSRTYTPQEQRNLEVVQGFWNNVFMERNPDRAREYLAENYLEHNPAVPGSPNGGVNAFIQFLNQFRARAGGSGAAAPAGAGPARGGGQPGASDVVLTSVDGEMVTMLRRQPAQDPANPADRYEAFGFEMFRVRDAKIVEHWDAARRIAPGQGPGVPPARGGQ